MTDKTLSEAIAELEKEKDKADPFCCVPYIEEAMVIIRTLVKREEVLREALDRGLCT